MQQWARTERIKIARQIFSENMIDYICTGHNFDDLAETFFMKINRGSSITSAVSFVPKRGRFISPILYYRKKEIITYLTHHRLVWREDASNQSLKYERNKYRAFLIPALDRINPLWTEPFALSYKYFHTAAAYIRKSSSLYISAEKDSFRLKRNFFTAGNGIKRLLLHNSLSQLLPGRRFSAGLLNDFLHKIKSHKKIWLTHSKSAGLYYSRPYICLEKVFSSCTLTVNSESGNHLKFLHLLSMQDADIKNVSMFYFSLPQQVTDITLRAIRPGDNIRLKGMSGRKKISRIFIDRKLPAYIRRSVMVITVEETIIGVWLPESTGSATAFKLNSQDFLLETSEWKYVITIQTGI